MMVSAEKKTEVVRRKTLGVKQEPTTSFTHMPGPYWVEVTDLTSCDNARQSSICQKNVNTYLVFFSHFLSTISRKSVNVNVCFYYR